jgi:hypothetical protein
MIERGTGFDIATYGLFPQRIFRRLRPLSGQTVIVWKNTRIIRIVTESLYHPNTMVLELPQTAALRLPHPNSQPVENLDR